MSGIASSTAGCGVRGVAILRSRPGLGGLFQSAAAGRHLFQTLGRRAGPRAGRQRQHPRRLALFQLDFGAGGIFSVTAGGDVTAARFIGDGSLLTGIEDIGSGDIQNDAILTRHIKDGEILSEDIKDESLTAVDIDGFLNDVSQQNVSVGTDALPGSTTGFQNTGIGAESLQNNAAGDDNTAIGAHALRDNTGGSNTAIGAHALEGNTTGGSNTALGATAGVFLTEGSNNIHIGNSGVAGEDATIKIGTQGTQTRAFLAGVHGTSVVGQAVAVDDAGQLGVSTFGSGSLLDADTVDGLQASAFAPVVGGSYVAKLGDTMVGTLTLSPVSGAALTTTSGNVGIGTATPGAQLEVNGDILLSRGEDRVIGTPDVAAGSGKDVIVQAGGNLVHDLYAHWGGELILRAGNANISGSTGCPNKSPYNNSLIIKAGDNVFGDNVDEYFVCSEYRNGDIIFYAGDGQPEVARIVGNTGYVGIGTEDPADKLHVAGDVRVGGGTTGCVKDADGTVIAGTCSSDARLKKNIRPLPEMLDRVARLTPVYFNWRSDEFPERALGDEVQLGLIAQEVQRVVPELVVADEDGFLRVGYSQLPLLLLQALKEQQRENAALRETISDLSERVRALEQ